MSDLKVEDLLQTGKTLVQQGEWAKALKVFGALYSRKKEFEDPETIALVTSYFGLAKAKGGRQWQEGLQLCEEARNLRAYLPECYVNLAIVYLERESELNREKAHQLLEAALKIDGRNRAALKLLREIDGGGRSAIPFLSPNNPLNILLGKGKRK